MVEPCSVEFTRIVFANNVETLSDEVTVRFCVVIVEPVIVVLTVIVSVTINAPVAVLYVRFSLLIEPDCALNTVIVDPDAVEKFKLRTLI